jgi:hypothetical protein
VDVLAYDGVVVMGVGGIRRVDASSHALESKSAQPSSNPGGGRGGTCFGDSGGPVLLGGTDIVVAVNSFVLNGDCAGQGFGYRTDQDDVIAWILPDAGSEAAEINIVSL